MGGISQMRLGNGRWETAKFNTRMQATELGLGSSATDAGVWKTQYEHGELDANGNVDASKNTGNIARQTLTVPGTSFVQSYRYDSLYRLTEAAEKTGSATNWSQTWSYDRYGNRIGFAQDIAGNTNAPNPTVDPNTNRFNAGQGFGYDANGNVVSDVDPLSSLPRQFVFNGDNKQSEVKRDGVTIGRYFYDGEGKRVKKETDTETTVFVYSAGKLIAEYSTQLSQSPSIAYTTTDHLGTPRVITDQFGQVKARRDFMPFGEELYTGIGGRTGDTGLKYSSNQDDIRQKFTGYQKDKETGLDFAEARMYENRLGRFTAIDPLLDSAKSAKPQSFNRFVYCYNNPLRYVDRDGQIPVETVIDVVSFAHSFWSLMRDPSLANVGFLVWDVAAVVIPYAPGSWAGRAAKSVLSGGAKVSREAAEWTSKVARDGYRGLRAQGIVGRGLATNLEKFLNNDYIKKGYALLSQGDDSTRRLLGMSASTKAADFVGVSKSGTFVVGEAKGYREIATGVEQLKNTMQALYNSVSRQGSGFKASAEIVIEGTAKEFLEKNILEYTLSGNQLMRQVGEKLVAETIQVVDAAGRRVAQIPVTVRFVQ